MTGPPGIIISFRCVWEWGDRPSPISGRNGISGVSFGYGMRVCRNVGAYVSKPFLFAGILSVMLMPDAQNVCEVTISALTTQEYN